MLDYFLNLSPVIQAFIATLINWLITALGAALVFIFKKINKNVLDGMLSISAGVMIAASFWSLLAPALDMADKLEMNAVLITVTGFLLGGLLLFISDKILHKYEYKFENSGVKRSIMLISSITLHNIPEGIAVGVAFGSIIYHLDGATLISAILLGIGIGIQNFPEGTAVSVPLRRDGMSRSKAFFYGQLSGIVEPISGVLGAILVLKIRYVLPLLLAFAAGAMIYVAVEELIPESQTNKNKSLMTMCTLIGFCIMMSLDVLLG